MAIAVAWPRNKLSEDWKKLLSWRLQQNLLHCADGVAFNKVAFPSLGLPKARIYVVLERKWLITCFSESSLKLCLSLSYPVFRDLDDVHDAQERQKTDPGKAEGLRHACIHLLEECYFSDFAKIWLFLKKTFLCFFQTYFPSQRASVFL